MYSGNKSCLVMVVRDEEPIIERCFESVKHLFTSYFICDTGSEDDTIVTMKDWLSKNGKYGTIHEKEWEGFGPTKSYNLEKFREDPICSNAEYILWLDADEVFIKDGKDPLSYLSEEDAKNLFKQLDGLKNNIFMFKTLFGSLEYWRWQIARNDRPYDWSDLPVQEFFNAPSGYDAIHLDTMFNLARKEGNSSRNPNRHLWDMEQLELYIERPGSKHKPRARFYLADTYRTSGEKQKALATYKELVELKENWKEEMYLSCMYASVLSDVEEEKIKYTFLAMEYSPERLEAICKLMMYYYKKGDFKKGYAFGSLATSNRENKNFLFFEKSVYDYHFDIHFSVCTYHSGHYQEGWYASQRIKDTVNEINVDQNKTNGKFNYNKYKEQIIKDISSTLNFVD